MASRSPRRLWSPRTRATVRLRASGGMPKRSFPPWTTSTGTSTASSSASRLGAGVPPRRGGGWGGEAGERATGAPAPPPRRAGAPGAGGPPAGDQPEVAELDRGETPDHGDPRGVELLRPRRGPAAG